MKTKIKLETKARDNHGHTYEAIIATSDHDSEKPILRYPGTPSGWYVETLLEGGFSEEIYVDLGQGWKIVNHGDVMRELISKIEVAE